MVKKAAMILTAILICFGGFFIYEVNKEHHYTPQTAEIVVNNADVLEKSLILKNNGSVQLDITEFISFVSDVENGTASLETTKKVFGFYECDIKRVYDEYKPVISYSISDTEIAAVDENGIITAASKGQAAVSVTADNVSIDIPITVYMAVDITQLEQDVVLLKGESKSFLALDEYEIVLAEFYSSDEKVVTVDKNGNAAAIGKGKAEIHTYRDEAKTDKISTTIIVKQPVESVNLNNLTLYTGESAALNASYLPQDADYGTSFIYKAVTESVAIVNGNVVTALKAGETIVTATSANGISTQAKLTVVNPPKAKPTVTTVTKTEYDSFKGEKFSDGSPYASYFKISFDNPVLGFKINYINDDGINKKTGSAIYNNAELSANSPVYFAVCINESDVLDTRGFSYTNKDGSKKFYSLHVSGKDGSVLMTEYQ